MKSNLFIILAILGILALSMFEPKIATPIWERKIATPIWEKLIATPIDTTALN